jgi:hypothetical protein
VQFSRLLLTFLLCGAPWAAAQGSSKNYQPANAQASAVPDLQRIVSGLEQAQRENHAHMVPYTVTREYQLFADKEQQRR